ncbi:MAG: hypothetical protein QG614_131 [Patescibacteria group bacterium]|nr:hypothetical protein [Patescibacteria group bacterium]
MLERFEIKKDQEVLEKNSVNASIFRMIPKGVFVPNNKNEVLEFVREVIRIKKEDKKSTISITPRAAGTCMSGGSITDEYIVSFTENLNRVVEFDASSKTIEIETGMYYRDFDKTTLKENLIMPTYPASRDLCAIGGMIGNNAGGEKTLKYGKTEDYVEAINMICSDGNEYRFKELKGNELDEVIENDNTFYGELHRKVLALIQNNEAEINNNKPKVTKNSSGYNLWGIYDKDKHSMDLTKLIVGSQGTLGVNTSAQFRLVENNTKSKMAVVFLKDIKDLPYIVDQITPLTPESFEIYDDHTFKISMKFLPQIIKRLGGSIFSLMKLFWPEFKMVLTGNIPKIIMLIEFVEKDNETLKSKIKSLNQIFDNIKLEEELSKRVQSHIVHTKKEALKYWVFRRESFNLLRSKLKDVRTVPFIEDVVVKASDLANFLPEFESILDEEKLVYTIAGHVGDGNVHVIPLMKLKDDKTIEQIKRISDEVYSLVRKYQGSLSGEHNDGIVRGPFLQYMFTGKMIELFKEVKNIFDPDNIFNPNKKVNIDWDYAALHIDRRK